MATRPLELQSLKWPFVGLAVLLALSTGWAVYDEVFPRRPWKNYQREFFKLDEAHLRADRDRAQRHLEDPETRKQLEASEAEYKAASDAISGNAEQRKAYDAAVRADDEAASKEAEGKLYLGFEKSKADAIYYTLREARHEGNAREEEEVQKKFEAKNRDAEEKSKVYNAAIQHHKETTAARLAFVQRRDLAQAKIDAIRKPIADIDKRLDSFKGLGKFPAMEQYWVAGLKNSWGAQTVDRCQNCHVAVNKGGFSAPWEVLESKKSNLPEVDMKAQYALDKEVIDTYQAIHDKICEEAPPPPSAIPIGGAPAASEPAAADPAAATECRPRAVYEKWLEMGAAYCGPNARALVRTKVVLKDKAGAVLAAEKAEWKGRARNPARDALAEKTEKPEADERMAQACTDKDTLAAFDEAAKADPFDVKPVFRTHPHRFEMLVKNHQPDNFGCTTCHGGEGAQTKGVEHKAFRHGEDDHDWNDPLTDEIHIMGKKYKGAFLQAKCDKCHFNELNLTYAPLASAGKKLFTDVGCWGCHPIEGYNELPRRGPTLLTIASKTSPGWLHTWIQYPKAWRPATRMPNFWPGAVDGSAVSHSTDAHGVPHPEGLTDEQALADHQKLRAEEVSAISAYLWTQSEPAKLLADTAPHGDPAAGKELFDSVGCRGCHVYEKDSAARRSEASKERDYAPNLHNIADKAKPEWIYSWVKNPKAMWPETKMPDLRLTDAEAANITAFLGTLKTDARYPEPAEYKDKAQLQRMGETGKTLIAKYGCFGCHNIKGFENAQKIGTELTEHGKKDANLLDFGDVKYFTEDPKHRQTYANWVWEKLHTPRIFAYERVETRMPQFDFTDDEALSILTFLKGQTGERPTVDYQAGQGPVKAAVLQGEKLVFWNGCRQCHIVQGRGGQVRDQYNEDNQSFAPPVLTGEGAKVQPAWLFAFLKGPYPLRPWLNIRMPTFHFPDQDATEVVHYFAAASNKSFPYLTAEADQPTGQRLKDTEELFKALQCTNCHVVGALRPGQDPGSAAPNFLMAKDRLRPDWIPLWLKNPQALLDGTRMPSFWDFTDEAHPTSPSKLFDGDAKEQINALRDYLMHLDLKPAQPGKSASLDPHHG